jgi:hypothetical protein
MLDTSTMPMNAEVFSQLLNAFNQSLTHILDSWERVIKSPADLELEML